MTETDYPTNEIGNLPGVSTFGHTFSYATWTPGTAITLCNVPWTNDYRDIVYYPNKSAFNSWIDTSANSGPKISLDKMTYCRPGQPVRINIPFNAAYQYNYLRVVNNAQPVTARTTFGNIPTPVAESGSQTLYYFILDVRYLAPNTTELIVQLDVWQSFQQEVEFGNCYIERGHVGIANENNFDNNGRDYLTVPEGLDVGSEYVINSTYENVVIDMSNESTSGSVMVASTTSFKGPFGTVDAPKLNMAEGSGYAGLPNGCDLYLFADVTDFQIFLHEMREMPWVTQGIISVTIVPTPTGLGDVGASDAFKPVAAMRYLAYRLIQGNASAANVVDTIVPSLDPAAPVADRRWLAQDWRDDIALGRYANLKKFLTYPYTVVELTTYSGTPLLLKPECMPGDDIVVVQKIHISLPSPRIVYMPYKYNAKVNAPVVKNSGGGITNDGGEMFDMMTGIFNLPTFSVVNNGYMSYMAANAHTIAYQHSSADWSQNRTMAGASADYSNTLRGINTGYANSQAGINALVQSGNLAQDTAGYRAMQGGANAVIGGAMQGGGRGLIGGAVGMGNEAASYAIETNRIQQQTAINARTQGQIARNTQDTGLQNADTNYAFAQYAAKGDYANTIAGINARVQDAKMIQPTTSGQMGGDAFNLALFKWGIFAKVKVLQPAVMAAIGEFWLRYGYAVNRFGTLPSDLQAMNKFTYWKLRETYLSSSTCPELFRQTIRGIFEKGVTVWSNPDDIGTIDIANNSPKAGITL